MHKEHYACILLVADKKNMEFSYRIAVGSLNSKIVHPSHYEHPLVTWQCGRWKLPYMYIRDMSQADSFIQGLRGKAMRHYRLSIELQNDCYEMSAKLIVVMADWDSQAHKKPSWVSSSRTVRAVYSVMPWDQNVAPIDYNLHVGVSECINTSGG